MPGKELRLLCLDGGGVRGLSSLQVLKQLMQGINAKSPPKPCDYFDMIGGTSTGGLQAIMLGRLKMSVDECIDAYAKLADLVFVKKRQRISFTGKIQSRYDSDTLVAVIKSMIYKAGFDDKTLLWNADPEACKVFVCAISQETSDVVHLTSFQNRRARDDLLKTVTIWEAARATSAATSFFDPIALGTHRTVFSDGATGANNPVYELWLLSKDAFYADDPTISADYLQQDIGCIVSIGTGVPGPKAFGVYPTSIAKALLSMTTETEQTARRFARDRSTLSDGGRYFRFNVPSGLDKIAMEDSKSKSAIIAVTDRYLEDQETFKKVENCAKILRDVKRLEIIIRTAVTQNTIASVGLENPRFHETSDSTDWFTTSPEYRSFLTSESATLLWYPGPPQSGKSTLVGRICQETLNQKSNNNVYCAYYSEITADRTSNKLDNFFARFPHRIFQRLLAQILIQTVKRDGSLGKAPQGQELPPTVKENIRLFPHYWSDVFTNVDYILPDTHNKIMKDLLLVTLVAIKPISVLLAIDDLDHMSVRNRETFLALLLNLWKELQRENVAVHILVISRPYSDIGALLEDVPTILQHRDYKECLATLYFDGMHTRRDQVRTALANTYQWIWKHPKYEEWYSADGSDKSSILWIRGKPGSGKSTLAKMIRASLGPLSSGLLPSSSGIETYSESDTTNATQSGPKSYDGSSRDVVADYFFSSRSGERSRSPKWMLQALLYQILAQNPKLYGHFRESFENIRASREAWNYDVLKQIFISLCTEVNQERVFIAPRFYLVIDAIDESESYNNIDRTDILDVLSTLCVQHNTGKKPACILKVLLIGRPTSDIDSKLRAFNSIEMHKQTLSDIEEIVSSGLDSILQSLRDPANRTSEMRDDDYDDDEEKHKSMVRKELEETNASDLIFIREYLLEHANGIILWVVLILKELTSLFLDGFWTLREIREMLSSLPRDLEQCYEEMIRRILKEVEKSGTRSRYGKERHLEKTLTMLSWAAFAFRPLTIQEFREIIAIGDFEARKVMPQAGLGSEPSTVVLAEHRLHNQKQVHKAVLYFCSGFLETVDGARLMTSKSRKYVSDTDILQLLHRSAKDFLLRNPRARPFQLQLASSSSSIALLSIKYLKLSFEVQDLAPHPESWEPDAYVHFINHLKSLPLLTYILFSLPKHLQATQSSELADDLSDYLSTLQHSSNTYAWRFLESWARQHKLLPRTNPDNDASNFRLRCSSLAAELGESEVVKLCIEAGVRDLSETLLAASRCGDLATVKAIFDQGQVRNLTSCKEAFFNSVQRGHLSIVNLIISSGTIQPDVRTDRGASALHRAAAEGHLRVLKYLISSGSDLEAEDENGVRPLHVAALSGKRAVVELLVSSGANLQRHTNKISKYEHTALTFAAMSGHLDIVKFLTRKYEQLDDMDVSGSIAMIREDGEQAIELAKTNRHIEVTLRLKEAWVRAESKSFAMFKLEDFDVAEAKARRRRGLGGEDNLQEAGLSREKAEEQNKLIESLIGGDLNPRESMHLLSLAQPSDERSRGTQRFSRAFLKSPQSSGGDGSNF